MSRVSDISHALVSNRAVEIAPVPHKPVKFIHDLKFYRAPYLDKVVWVALLVLF